MSDLNGQIYNAFYEFMVSRFSIPKAAVPAYWDIFYKGLSWRIWPVKYITNDPKGYPNCIFVKIPRTGTSSINEILKHTGGHKTVGQWRKHFTDEMWNRLFKFTIVRNPYTRFVSAYNLMKIDEDINKYLKKNRLTKLIKKNPVVFQTQYEFVYADGVNMVDYIGRFENLEEDWKHISSKIGCTDKLSHKHKSEQKIKLNKESKELIYTTYKKDFDTFEYRK